MFGVYIERIPGEWRLFCRCGTRGIARTIAAHLRGTDYYGQWPIKFDKV